MTSFSSLGVPAPLVAALKVDGKTEAFPIQVDTLPDTLAGRDVLGRGKTGSGKTIAFALPIAARLGLSVRPSQPGASGQSPRMSPTALGTGSSIGRRRAGHPLALVLAPTRELATQIAATLEPLAGAYQLSVTTVFGGVKQGRQVEALRAGVDILVACPGRLEDLMKQGFVSLDAVEITVLDEADHMADLGFLPVVTRILDKTPTSGQRMLFSATLDNGVDKLVKRFLHSPVLHSVDDETSHVDRMTHHVFEVESADAKTDLVRTLASGTGRSILFMRTKHYAKRLAKKLTEQGIPAVDLHGNLSQPQRDRNLAAFGDGSVRVMVATDVAARGVHVDDIELVVHVDPPTEHKAYLHRSGRTARAGATGDVVTIVLPEQRRDVKDVLRKAAITARPMLVTADSAEVARLVGEVAPYVKPAPKAPQQQRATRDDGRSRGGAAPAPQRTRAGASIEGRPERPGASAEGRTGGSRRRRGRGSGAASGQHASGQHSSGQHASGQSAGAQAGQPARQRTTSQPAGRQSGRAPIRVGDVVRPNGGTSRGRGPRRAQG